MSIIIKFFVAPSPEAAAAVVDGGPDGAFESLVYGNFDAEEALIEWESIFTGRSSVNSSPLMSPKPSLILAMGRAPWFSPLPKP